MHWDKFNTRDTDERRAFEAFSGQLFEHFCRRTFGASLLEVRFVNGDGGDGGVEAYALVRSNATDQPDVIGLQAKWFRDPIKDTQIKEIKKSFKTAIAVRPRLVRYCIAIPRNLGDDRVGTKFSERQRFEKWKKDAMAAASNTTIELWNETRIHDELTRQDNEGVEAYWFSQSVVRQQFFRERFEIDEKGWLLRRYLPHLHAPGQLEADLDFRLGGSNARKNLLDTLDPCLSTIRVTCDDIARLDRYPVFMALPNAQVLLTSAHEVLERLIRTGERLQVALRRGSRINEPLPITSEDYRTLYELDRTLEEIETRSKSSGWAATHDIAKRVALCIRENVEGRINESSALSLLYDLWESFQQQPALVAYVGGPGIGKTHGLANAVKTRLDDELPALLLRAKDCPIEKGWSVVLAEAIDWPNAGRETILNALEATCIRADVKRAGNVIAAGEVEFEPTWFLLAIDGLEEGGQHARWAERLGELTQILQAHPRIRVAVTLRTLSGDAILKQLPRDGYDELDLRPDEEEVQALLLKYCRYYGVEIPHRRLRWALRDALSVRLYCDIRQNVSQWDLDRPSFALPALLSKKLDSVENAIRESIGFSPCEHPLRGALSTLAAACVERRRIRRDEAIERARQTESSIDSRDWSRIFDAAEQAGLLLVSTHENEHPLAPRVTTVEPAYDPLTDYLVADAAVIELVKAVKDREKSGSSESISIPQMLRSRPDACAQVAILLAEKYGISLIESGMFQGVFTPNDIATLELRTIAALDANRAAKYRPWVTERLTASMPSCRRVLKELCIPVSRDPEHPFGPKFVHKTLLQYETPAKRDLFWSGPAMLPGNGDGPWEGDGDKALETLTLDVEDAADGPPLLLAWALTSVDNVWRRKVRAKLASWGGKRLDVLPSWLDLVTQTNDPQMMEDVAMIAFGAACLAGTDTRLANLVLWADTHWLMPESPNRQENIVVLHAARGIVERARVMGIDVSDATLERARQLYVVDDRLLPIDEKAAREADDYDGIRPITGDLAWYVVPQAVSKFFNTHPRISHTMVGTRQLFERYARETGMKDMSPMGVLLGILMAHLREMGWNADQFYGQPCGGTVGERVKMDIAIERRYPSGTQGERSTIACIAEKYVWTGCHVIQAYLAGRVDDHPLDPTLVAKLPTNPATDVKSQTASECAWKFWVDDRFVEPIALQTELQHERALEWVRRAPVPDLRPWLVVPHGVGPAWSDDDWIVLYAIVEAAEPASQGLAILHGWSAVVPRQHADTLANEREDAIHRLSYVRDGFSERVYGRTYSDPSETSWAPWATGVGGTHRSVLVDASGTSVDVDLMATTAKAYWESAESEEEIWLPAHWLRSALGPLDVRRLTNGTGYCYVDKANSIIAFETNIQRDEMRSIALLVRRQPFIDLLAERDLALLWSGRVVHELMPPMRSAIDDDQRQRSRRKWDWIAIMGSTGPEIVAIREVVKD